jgi:hypothetical protein
MGALLQLVGKGSDHQIAAEPQRKSAAMQFAPARLQILCRAIEQSSNFAVGFRRARLSCSVVPLSATTEKGRRLARVLASRRVVSWRCHTLAGSAMR